MSHAGEELPRPLEQYRDYLGILARLHLGPWLQGLMDSSDIVQETLLKAHENLSGFRGKTDGELRAWLRTILAQQLALIARKRGRQPVQAHSLELALEQSSARLESLLAADESSPSQQQIQSERLIELAAALATLPEDQRTALELRYLDGLPVADVAARMNRSSVSVTGLLYRGTKALRGQLDRPP
ncbi:MAG: sigma-70 family RNA polymerase sigma factor [Isosphaeraceae bacterium]